LLAIAILPDIMYYMSSNFIIRSFCKADLGLCLLLLRRKAQ